MKGEPKPEWTAQLNSQKYLIEENTDHKVDKLQICAIGRDWSKNQAKVKSDYPNKQVKLIPIELWPKERTESFLKDRISLLQSHENTPDNDLPLCTQEETWQDNTKYACIKKGNKRATKVFDSPLEAEIFSKTGDFKIDKREAEPKRCIDYCSVNKFCNQYQEYLKGKEDGE